MPEAALIPSAVIRRAADEARERSGLGARKLEASVGLSPYYLRGLLDQNRPQVPSVDRADEICRALGITMTIGAAQSTPRSVDEVPYSQISGVRNPGVPFRRSPSASPEERQIDGGRLAEFFEIITRTYKKTRAGGERDLVLHVLRAYARASTSGSLPSWSLASLPSRTSRRSILTIPEVSLAHYTEYAELQASGHFDESRETAGISDKRRPVVAFVPAGPAKGGRRFPRCAPLSAFGSLKQLQVAERSTSTTHRSPATPGFGATGWIVTRSMQPSAL